MKNVIKKLLNIETEIFVVVILGLFGISVLLIENLDTTEYINPVNPLSVRVTFSFLLSMFLLGCLFVIGKEVPLFWNLVVIKGGWAVLIGIVYLLFSIIFIANVLMKYFNLLF